MDPTRHIDKLINLERPEEVKKNRLRLATTIQSVMYLTLQGCTLRGHDERPSSKNRGNVIELIKIFAKLNVEIENVVLENAPGNAQFIVGSIQKEILSLYAKTVRNIIRKEIGKSKFCILVDEATDVSDKTQMAIVLRFVDARGHIRERFFDIVNVNDTCSKTLKEAICIVLGNYNLQISDMRGQGYDGASNMSGARNGLKALFLKDCPYAYYAHCFAHRLQLTLVGAAEKVRPIWWFVSHLNKLVNLVGASPERVRGLKSAQAIEIAKEVATGERKTSKGANQMGSLHRPGQTRWSSHFESTCSLIDMFPAVIKLLEYMDVECSNTTEGEAYGCKIVMKTFDFVFILFLMNKSLGLLDMLCRSLQKKYLDILNAMDLVSTTKKLLQELGEGGFDFHQSHVESFCGNIIFRYQT